MLDRQIVQYGTPSEVYRFPASLKDVPFCSENLTYWACLQDEWHIQVKIPYYWA